MELNEKPYTIQGSKRDIILKYINPFHKFCLSALVYPLINGFIVISDPLAEFINKFKSDTSIICKIPILVDFNFYQEDVKMPACKIPYIIHTAIPNDNKDGIINVFLAFSKIVSELGIDLHFYLTSKIGMTKVRGIIYEIINRHNLNQRVTFLGDLEEESLIEYQKYCCMVVINKVFSEQNKYNFATKIGEYLALGKPIITTKYGEVTTYLKDNISCLYVDPTDVDDIAKAMTRIITDSKLRKTLESQGKLIAQNIFDYHSQSKLINTFFKEVSKKY
jgi:glycosyltransferase involved in cell wall biosynthesis